MPGNELKSACRNEKSSSLLFAFLSKKQYICNVQREIIIKDQLITQKNYEYEKNLTVKTDVDSHGVARGHIDR